MRFALDTYAPDPLVMMAAVKGETLDPEVEARYLVEIRKHAPQVPAVHRLERRAFSERARQAFAVVMTGETAIYGNIMLKKGVTPFS